MSMLARLMPRGASDSGVVVEPMRRKHIAKLMPIERASYPRPWTEGVFQSELDQARRDQRHYLVARVGREVAAYGGLMFALDEAHVTNIAVHPDHRRQRLGTRLLAELAHEAIRRNCTAMTLEVRVSNVAAQALYREFGFVPAGVRQRYYENTEDAMVMWCHDIALPEYMSRLQQLCPEAGR
jgi:[ribosomal protein S18]-alanine N-acetyltransferase